MVVLATPDNENLCAGAGLPRPYGGICTGNWCKEGWGFLRGRFEEYFPGACHNLLYPIDFLGYSVLQGSEAFVVSFASRRTFPPSPLSSTNRLFAALFEKYFSPELFAKSPWGAQTSRSRSLTVPINFPG